MQAQRRRLGRTAPPPAGGLCVALPRSILTTALVFVCVCSLYFSLSSVSSLRPLDVEFMRRLSKVVNIVPVIAKADTLTLEERDFFKKKVGCSSFSPHRPFYLFQGFLFFVFFTLKAASMFQECLLLLLFLLLLLLLHACMLSPLVVIQPEDGPEFLWSSLIRSLQNHSVTSLWFSLFCFPLSLFLLTARPSASSKISLHVVQCQTRCI